VAPDAGDDAAANAGPDVDRAWSRWAVHPDGPASDQFTVDDEVAYDAVTGLARQLAPSSQHATRAERAAGGWPRERARTVAHADAPAGRFVITRGTVIDSVTALVKKSRSPSTFVGARAGDVGASRAGSRRRACPPARWRQVETDEPCGGVWADAAMQCARTRGRATIVSDQGSGRVVWASKGKDIAAAERFFDDLGFGPERTRKLDRFHVQRLAHEAL
jgi:hypothetical protein